MFEGVRNDWRRRKPAAAKRRRCQGEQPAKRTIFHSSSLLLRMLTSNNTEQTTMTDIENVAPVQNEMKALKSMMLVKELEHTEPILLDNPNRFVLFPIKYNDVSQTSLSIILILI